MPLDYLKVKTKTIDKKVSQMKYIPIVSIIRRTKYNISNLPPSKVFHEDQIFFLEKYLGAAFSRK